MRTEMQTRGTTNLAKLAAVCVPVVDEVVPQVQVQRVLVAAAAARVVLAVANEAARRVVPPVTRRCRPSHSIASSTRTCRRIPITRAHNSTPNSMVRGCDSSTRPSAFCVHRLFISASDRRCSGCGRRCRRWCRRCRGGCDTGGGRRIGDVNEMNSLRAKWNTLKTYRRVRNLWEEYKKVAEVEELSDCENARGCRAASSDRAPGLVTFN
jgi:hypothetical protein